MYAQSSSDVSDRQKERKGGRKSPFYGQLPFTYSLFLMHPQSSPAGTDQNGSPEVSSISTPHYLFSLAFSFLSASFQQTFSQPSTILSSPFSCSPFRSKQGPFLSGASRISSELSLPQHSLCQHGLLHLHHAIVLYIPFSACSLQHFLWQPSVPSPYLAHLKWH